METDCNVAHITTTDISCYLPQHAANIVEQTRLKEHIIPRAQTKLSYIERSVVVKPVDTQINWFFGLTEKSGIDLPVYIILGFPNRY